MKESKNPRKPLMYYYIISMLFILFLNAVIIPYFVNKQITEVDYGTFLSHIESGKVEEVEIIDKNITFTIPNVEGKSDVYATRAMNDPDLVNRLEAKDIKFGDGTKDDSLLKILINFILPILIFVMIGQLFFKALSSKMGGGNAMAFGKSNAKVYVAAETGKTFDDVAGQDEAKEALMEIAKGSSFSRTSWYW